jgi:hypothetical protein
MKPGNELPVAGLRLSAEWVSTVGVSQRAAAVNIRGLTR